MTAGTVSPGIQAVRVDEPLAGQHLVGAARLDPAPAPQEQIVDARPPVARESTRAGRSPARRGPGRSSVTVATTRVSIADDARDGGDVVGHAQRRPLQRGEDVGEPLPLVVRPLRLAAATSKFERYITNIATPAATTIAMASACPFIAEEIAQELPVERGERHGAHHDSSRGASFCRCALRRRHAAVGEPDHAVGHRRDRRVVRDDDGGGAELRVHARERLEHDDAGGDVERAGRLVAEQHRGPLGDRARDRDALLLAAGELRRKVVAPRRRGRRAPAPPPAASGRSEISVTSATFSRAVRLGNQVVELEDEADVVPPVAR